MTHRPCFCFSFFGLPLRFALWPVLIGAGIGVESQLSLLSWKLQSGGLALAYLNRAAIVSAIAVPGAAVRTEMGLGTVQLVREDGVVVVSGGGFSDDRGTGGAGGATGVSTDRARCVCVLKSGVMNAIHACLFYAVHTDALLIY